MGCAQKANMMKQRILNLILGSVALVFAQAEAKVCFQPRDSSRSLWSYEAGILWISNDNIGDIFLGNNHTSTSPAGGQIYSMTAAYRWGDLKWGSATNPHHVEFELPQTLEIINEKSAERSPFVMYNTSFLVRWVEFPWNDYVKTTFGMGVGITYMTKVPLIDIDRHPDDTNRSRVKFNWPIQMTFALPSRPEHQLMLFLGHHSGGHIFDVGGFNSVGLGYRFAM